jgi:hypothetical protein
VAEVVARLRVVNPRGDGRHTLYESERLLVVSANHLDDVAPLAALGDWLEHLRLDPADKPTAVKDVSGLRGLKLKGLHLASTRVADLSPLAGMPLRSLSVENTDVADLSPLEGMPLRHVRLGGTAVTDLAPLGSARLVTLDAGSLRPRSWAPVAGGPPQTVGWAADPAGVRAAFPDTYRRIEFIQGQPAPLFWGDDTTFVRTTFPPLDETWLAAVRGKPAAERLPEVVAELRRRNPEWGGETYGTAVSPAGVRELGLYTGGLRDLSPLRALPTLNRLRLNRLQTGTGPLLTDLESIRGLKLKEFWSDGQPFLDLAALRGMPLRAVHLRPYHRWYDGDLKAIPTLETVNDRPALAGR